MTCIEHLRRLSHLTFQSHFEHGTVSGILKGFDQLINLVLDESKETVRGACCLVL